MEANHYATLCVDRYASKTQVSKAFRVLVAASAGDAEAVDRLCEAYETLVSPTLRKKHDMRLELEHHRLANPQAIGWKLTRGAALEVKGLRSDARMVVFRFEHGKDAGRWGTVIDDAYGDIFNTAHGALSACETLMAKREAESPKVMLLRRRSAAKAKGGA